MDISTTHRQFFFIFGSFMEGMKMERTNEREEVVDEFGQEVAPFELLHREAQNAERYQTNSGLSGSHS